MQSYGRVPIPSVDEQVLLGRAVRAWLDHTPPCPPAIARKGQKARDRLVRGNLRLVVAGATRWRRGVDYNEDKIQDLIQAGTLGLIRAAEKFDPSRGYTFSTYSHAWIQQALGRFIYQEVDMIRVPLNRLDNWRLLSKLANRYRSENAGQFPPLSWLIDQTGFCADRISRALVCGQLRVVHSLDALMRNFEEDGSSLLDVLPDPASLLDVVEEESFQQARVEFAQGLIDLPQVHARDRAYLQATYLRGQTLADTAEQNRDSRARAGQLRQRGVANIREFLRESPDFDPQVLEHLGLELSQLELAAA